MPNIGNVKILSGWSNPGGSTVAHINLCNLLNANGINCTFYGPHEWHLDKCKSSSYHRFAEEEGDVVISHFCNINPERLKYYGCRHILYCHEKDLFPLKGADLSTYDYIVFVSEAQRKWHDINHPSVIIPPIVDKIDWVKPNNGVAGVIGSVDKNKGTHISIKKALEAGFSKVNIYGRALRNEYFEEQVLPCVNSADVEIKGHYDSKEDMYNEVDAVFHYSNSETYGLVEAECKLAGIPFYGLKNKREILSKEETLKAWKKILLNTL